MHDYTCSECGRKCRFSEVFAVPNADGTSICNTCASRQEALYLGEKLRDDMTAWAAVPPETRHGILTELAGNDVEWEQVFTKLEAMERRGR